MRGSRACEASLQERLVFEEDALRKRDLFSVAAGDSGQLPDKYDPVSVFLHQNYQRHYHEAVAVNHHPKDEEEEKKKTDSTLPLSAEASFVSEDDDGPPEDTSDLALLQARGSSKLTRFLDTEEKLALMKAEYMWNDEEDAALIKRRSIPQVQLTRSQSAQRRHLVGKLGGSTMIVKEDVRDFQLADARPDFSFDSRDIRSWQKPAEPLVREYVRISEARSKQLQKETVAIRRFPCTNYRQPNAKESAIRFYIQTKNGKARLNPYADVETLFSSKKYSVAVVLKHRKARADPFKANAYIDQDDAASVAKRARQIRIRISQMGLVNKALRVKKAGENDGFLPGDKAWKKFPLQPTQITLDRDDIVDFKVLEKRDPRLQVSPTCRRGHTMIKVDGNHALVFGGALGKGFQYSSQLFKFFFNSNKFEQVDVCGTRPCGRAFHSATWCDHSKMVIYGGLGKQGSLEDCFEYNTRHAQWSILFQNGPIRPSPRYGHTLTETNMPGILILYGGAGAGFFGDLCYLDTRTGQWQSIKPNGKVPEPRAFHSAITLAGNTQMFIFGGQNGSANLADLQEYNIDTNTWTFVRTHGVQPSPRWSHCAVRKGNDGFFVFGGAGETYFDEILYYNSYHFQWRQAYGLGPAPAPRWGHTCVYQDEMGIIFVFGGATKEEPSNRDLYQFSMEGILWGAPPNKHKSSEFFSREKLQRNPLANMIMQEKSDSWTEKKIVPGRERHWSASGKRNPQGSVVVLTQVAPFAAHHQKLYKTVGAPTIGTIHGPSSTKPENTPLKLPQLAPHTKGRALGTTICVRF